MKTKTSHKKRLFDICRAINGISLKEFALCFDPPVSYVTILDVLRGKIKSRRIEKGIDDFISLNGLSIPMPIRIITLSALKKIIKNRTDLPHKRKEVAI